MLIECFGDIEYIDTDAFQKIIQFTTTQNVTDVHYLKLLAATIYQAISLLNTLSLEQLDHAGVFYSALLLPGELVFKYI